MQKNVRKDEHIPALIEGNLCVDDRGEVTFVNDFDMAAVRRFYTVTNHRSGFVRAWHGHKKEAKFVTVVNGAALVAVVKIDNWEKPSKDSKIFKFVLSSKKPSVLSLPAGYVNGAMTLTKDTQLMYFSTVTLDESSKDDIRFDAYYWNPWKVIER